MKKLLCLLLFTLMGYTVNAQCPIPPTAFVGDYNIVQTTPNNTAINVPSFESQVVTLSIGATPNGRVFSAVYAEALPPDQPAMDVTFTLDCPNGSDVIVDAGLDTFLTCDQMGNITLGPAATTGTFNQNDDSSFTLILEEFQTDGGCNVAPSTVEFLLTKTSCNAPQNVTVTNITATTADVSWTDPNGGMTTFDVEYGVEGFAIGNGTVISGISTTSTQLTGLLEGNYYDVYVNAVCASGTSVPTGPVNFLNPTDCNMVYSGFPITEDFDSGANFDSCYTVIDQDGNGTAWIQQTLELSPGIFSTFATNGTNDTQKEDYLFSPAINLTAGNTYDISVRYNGADSGGGPASEDLEVLMASGNTVADANAGTSIFTDTGIAQNGAFADVDNQALTNAGQFTPSTTGLYHLVFKTTTVNLPPNTATGFLLVFDYTIDETLSVNEFETLDFDYFTNNLNILNLSANQSFSEIKLYDLKGQEVLNQKLSNPTETVDLNKLTRGLYIAQVQIGNINETFKVIKR